MDPHPVSSLMRLGVPIVFFIGMISVVLRMRSFAKKWSVFASAQGGDKQIRITSPFGGLSVSPNDGRDPALEGMPKYPGASLADPAQPAAAAEIDLGGKRGRYLVQQLSTEDPVSVVGDYYRVNFPEWVQDHQYDSGTRFRQDEPGCSRCISIQRASGRTHIQYEVVFPGSSATASGTSLG